MLIAALLVVAVIYLAQKAPDPNAAPSGEPNGTSTAGMSVGTGQLMNREVVPWWGANGSPSPLTGGGLPGSSQEAILMIQAASPFASQRGSGNGIVGSGYRVTPDVSTSTGVLNPLPEGQATKTLQTQYIQPLVRNGRLATTRKY